MLVTAYGFWTVLGPSARHYACRSNGKHTSIDEFHIINSWRAFTYLNPQLDSTYQE